MLSEYFWAKTKTEKFKKHIDNLCNEIKDKKILLYGAGEAFVELNKTYQLDKYNIIGIADKKFKQETLFNGIKAIIPDNIPNIDYDIILITAEATTSIEKFLKEKLNIDENKIKTIFVEEAEMERANYLYLQSFKFEKHIKKLTKKLQNKTIVLYGAGAYLKTIKNFYDISGLNIVGISDKRFEKEENSETEFLGYKAIKPEDIKKINPDYVLVATKFFINIIEDLMLNTLAQTKIKVRPLVKKSYLTLIKEIW